MKLTLSKQFLKEQQITIEVDPNEKTGYKIMHYSQNKNTKEMSWKKINPSLSKRYHRISGNTMTYYVVSWSDYKNSKRSYTVPLSRLVYLCFSDLEELPTSMDIDHINNNSLDNRFENLQLLTRRENLLKRVYGMNYNQYTCNKFEVKDETLIIK